MISGKKIVVMACTHPYWSVIQVGSQHIARQFAKNGWEVHYISAPISIFHLPVLYNYEIIKRFKFAFQYRSVHQNGEIKSYIPFSLIAPTGCYLLRDKIVTNNWHRTMIPFFKCWKKKMGIRHIDLLYIDNLFYHFLFNQLSFDKSLFRVMDVHESFPGWKSCVHRLATKIAKYTNITIFSALGLKDYVDTLGAKRTAFVPNGVDFDLFQTNVIPHKKHQLFKNIPEPIFLYTGTIDNRLDFNLIRASANIFSQVSFVFTGPVCINIKVNNLPSNVYFTGPVQHNQIPQLMHSATAGLIPFDVKTQMNLIKGIRPLKLFEYMAVGLPVISAKWPELEKMNSPVWLYDNQNEFVDYINKAITNKYDRTKAINFAKSNDWNYSFSIMEEILRQQL